MFVRTKVQARDYRRLSKNSCRHAFSSRQPATFHFDPVRGRIGDVRPIDAFGHDAFEIALSAGFEKNVWVQKFLRFPDERARNAVHQLVELAASFDHYIRPRFCNGLNPIPPNGCAGKGRSNDTNVGALRRGVAYRGRTRPAASLGGLRDRSSAVPATGSSAISSSASSARSLATGSCARSISPSISEVRSRIELSSQSWGRCSSCSSLGCSVHAVCASASTNVWRR